MMTRRTERLNSLLQQVISDIIHKEVKNPHLPELCSITHVDITKDLRHAKVYVSVIGSPEEKKAAIEVLQSASGFIAVRASKEVVMRYFPELTFIIDDTADKQMHIDHLIAKIESERSRRSDNA